MAFGQQSGPPASAREIAQLEELLGVAGYSSFREARHPYGLSQRQAGGKFSRAEADDLLRRLTDEAESTSSDSPAGAVAAVAEQAVTANRATADRTAQRRADRQAEAVAALPDDLLADELVRRGWVCMPPG